MQEEVEQKTFNIVVSTTKLTARTILNAGKAAIQQQQAKMAGGKQSVRMLLRQNRGVSSVEIDKTNIRGFERYAKKYGIDYAILQLRGVRPFLSDKYDITKHPNYPYTADADPKNAFDIEAFLSTRLKLKPNEVYDVYEVDAEGV